LTFEREAGQTEDRGKIETSESLAALQNRILDQRLGRDSEPFGFQNQTNQVFLVRRCSRRVILT
jgi:hypothetical protein